MKKIKNLLALVIIVISVHVGHAQTATNADGTIKFRGNVAIIVEGHDFAFKNGQFVKVIDDEAMLSYKTALRLLAIQSFQNMGFGVVNRDDDAFNQVSQVLRENRLEDYLNGFSVQAKGQGADYLFVVGIANYSENDVACQFEIATRLINIETNFGYHYVYKSEATQLNSENDMRKNAKKLINEFSVSLEKQLTTLFPEQYFVAKTNGKKWSLGAYQPNGRILKTDKFYAFKFRKESLSFGNGSLPLQVIDEMAVGECSPETGGGSLVINANKPLSNFSDIVLFRNISEPIFMGSNQMPITFFGLKCDLKSYEGLCKNRINNAIFRAITRHVGLQLIEHDHLPEVKKERELQKGEDFIDGHVVEQLKAFGAQNLLTIEGFSSQGAQVSFKMSLISVAENRIARSVDIVSSIDNIENEMYKQLCNRFAYPCGIKLIDKNTVRVSSILSLPNGTNCVLEVNKLVKNPMTGEISYSLSDLCTLKAKEYHGNQTVMSIEEVFNKEDIKKIEEWGNNGNLTYRIDGSEIKSNVHTKSEVMKEAEKKEKSEKRKAAFKSIGNSLLKNTTITTK